MFIIIKRKITNTRFQHIKYLLEFWRHQEVNLKSKIVCDVNARKCNEKQGWSLLDLHQKELNAGVCNDFFCPLSWFHDNTTLDTLSLPLLLLPCRTSYWTWKRQTQNVRVVPQREKRPVPQIMTKEFHSLRFGEKIKKINVQYFTINNYIKNIK